MKARWHVLAQFGHKQEAISLLKEWRDQIGSQTNIDATGMRMITGSVGANEALIEMEFEIADLDALQQFYDKIGSITMHADWGKKMGEVVVSGSTRWEVFRVVG